MKATLFFLAALALAGCASPTSGVSPGMISQILDSTLPPTFTGPAVIRHKNPYTTINIDAEGLKRGAAGWEWSWLRWKREGRVSDGEIELGTRPRR